MREIDDVWSHMNLERAKRVRRLRVEEGYSLRALAVACADEWGTNWGSNQGWGQMLCDAAATMLGDDPADYS